MQVGKKDVIKILLSSIPAVIVGFLAVDEQYYFIVSLILCYLVAFGLLAAMFKWGTKEFESTVLFYVVLSVLMVGFLGMYFAVFMFIVVASLEGIQQARVVGEIEIFIKIFVFLGALAGLIVGLFKKAKRKTQGLIEKEKIDHKSFVSVAIFLLSYMVLINAIVLKMLLPAS
jgi:hypothetical protein